MEQTISSTYLWTLSEKFIKRKNPISKLAGLISLILQILVIAVISLSIAHPIISIPDSANEYCFILDASGSMNMEQNGETRFERGKSKIANKIDEAPFILYFSTTPIKAKSNTFGLFNIFNNFIMQEELVFHLIFEEMDQLMGNIPQ